MQNGLVDLVRQVRDREITSIAVPALGCGNDGLAWADVRPLIEEAFAALPDVRVVLFPPTGTPAASEMPVATRRPQLTSNRAALLLALHRYLAQARSLSSRSGVSELEAQKLAYFLQMLGQPAKLVFVRGRYGPYAEQLNYVLQELESHVTIGYGDRSARVTDLAPIDLTDGTADEVSAWLDKNDSGERRRVDRLMELVDGFETPYSLELLATAHFAAHQEPATASADVVSQRVARWNLRKARLFTASHVAVAVDHLCDHDLVELGT